jgi:hypothetical protein
LRLLKFFLLLLLLPTLWYRAPIHNIRKSCKFAELK